jgi:hypothetical protein
MSSGSLVPMSALGQKQTFGPRNSMSALPPKADMIRHRFDFRFVPKADIMQCSNLLVIYSAMYCRILANSCRGLKGFVT